MPSKEEYDAAYRRLSSGNGTPADVALAQRMSGLSGGEGTPEGRRANKALSDHIKRGGKT
ncbi:hypothetical protein HGB25_03120 [Candidatus Saccharibacteria bacterium]|nr:hypothetical protein [Candidatus Saccharibacteria bacterium]